MKCYLYRFQDSFWLLVIMTIVLFGGPARAQATGAAVSDTPSEQSAHEGSLQSMENILASKEDDEQSGSATTETKLTGDVEEEDAAVNELKTTVLRVTVTQTGGDEQPIKDARVIVTYDNAREFELKTDEQGVALLTGLPYGKVDVDVTSSGWKSGGGKIVLDAPEKTLSFKLKPRAMDE